MGWPRPYRRGKLLDEVSAGFVKFKDGDAQESIVEIAREDLTKLIADEEHRKLYFDVGGYSTNRRVGHPEKSISGYTIPEFSPAPSPKLSGWSARVGSVER